MVYPDKDMASLIRGLNVSPWQIPLLIWMGIGVGEKGECDNEDISIS